MTERAKNPELSAGVAKDQNERANRAKNPELSAGVAKEQTERAGKAVEADKRPWYSKPGSLYRSAQQKRNSKTGPVATARHKAAGST